MAIDIRCEWCNRRVATVSYKNVREFIQKNGEVCKKCTAQVEKLDAFFLKKQERFMQAFNKLLDKAKEDFAQEAKRLANARDSSE